MFVHAYWEKKIQSKNRMLNKHKKIFLRKFIM